jgi:hypothetical protein
MTTGTEHLEGSEPALSVTVELPPRAGGPERLEIRLTQPAERDAASSVAQADEGEPTWEDAEWE